MSDEPRMEPSASATTAGRRPRMATAVKLAVALLAIAALAYGAVYANGIWGRRAMARTALVGVEALIEGRANDLAAVSTKDVRVQLTPSVRAAMGDSAILADFRAPQWQGDKAMVRATTGMGDATIIVTPDPNGRDIVGYVTTGAFGSTAGALNMVRTWDGWRISGLAVQPAQ